MPLRFCIHRLEAYATGLGFVTGVLIVLTRRLGPGGKRRGSFSGPRPKAILDSMVLQSSCPLFETVSCCHFAGRVLPLVIRRADFRACPAGPSRSLSLSSAVLVFL